MWLAWPGLDRILPHKRKLEQHLKQRYGELFGAEFDVLLYDLTSTTWKERRRRTRSWPAATRGIIVRTASRW